MDWYKKEESFKSFAEKAQRMFDRFENDKKDIEYLEDILIKDYIMHIKDNWSMAFPWDAKLYNNIMNGDKEDEKILLDCVKRYVCKDIEKFDEFMWYGMNRIGFEAVFTVNGKTYQFLIPIRQNIGYEDVVSRYLDGRVDWSVGKFILWIRDKDKDYCWNHIWSGWDFDDDSGLI